MSPPGTLYTDYNQTVLDLFDYVIYPGNGTVSNVSNCYLSFGSYHPEIYADGTVENNVSCDSPYYGIASRGGIGIAFGALSILMLPFSMNNLHRLGKMHVKREHKRFRLISRRWQWYWVFVIHALSAVAGFLSIDIDRDYIQGTSLTSYGAVFTSIFPCCLGAVWEMTRHWGSFEERQSYEDDPYGFRDDKLRTNYFLLAPIFVYLFGFLFFLLTVLRNWTNVIRVNSDFIVDSRWKVGIFLGVVCFILIITHVFVIRHYWHPKRLPWRIPLCFLGVAVMLSYSIALSFDGSLSPFNPSSSVVAVSVWGYIPVLYLLFVMNITANFQKNDDKVILEQRAVREQERMRVALETVVVHDDDDAGEPTVLDEEKTLDGSSPLAYSATYDFDGKPRPSQKRTYTNAEIKAFARANAKRSNNTDEPS
ncbi:hypothetical protein BZA70DRAFT_265604 [Myxozyma melibiosi]|uniref:Uncharacterized protein n=1 Tax=Myxozyma melibiosi TaxID=54550 RepID=A0ABR1FEN2_9ASCO